MVSKDVPLGFSLVGEQTVAVPIRGSLRELARVREKVRSLLAGYPAPTVADAVQVTDELVSHGFRHDTPPRMVWLALIRASSCVRVEVEESVPTPKPLNCCAECRLGEALLHTLATRWGVRETGRWAELGLLPVQPGT